MALGRCGLYFELWLKLWDYAAAALITAEAGCTHTSLEGNPLAWNGPTSMICLSRGVKTISDCFSVHRPLVN